MQTLYYTTENFIRHTGNVVDLTEYRRRLARTQQEQGGSGRRGPCNHPPPAGCPPSSASAGTGPAPGTAAPSFWTPAPVWGWW